MNAPFETPLADLRASALAHYEELASAAHCWLSTIPQAINAYFDAKEVAARPTPPSDAGPRERETGRPPKPELPVTAVWLRRIGDEVEAWVEIAGDWYLPCSEHFDGPFSHIAESRGIKHWRKMPPLVPAEEAS